MNNDTNYKRVEIPIELIKALFFAGEETLIIRFENERSVSCIVEGNNIVIEEEIIETTTDDECEDDFEKDFEIPEACYECPHFCPVCNECIKDE